MTLRDYSRPPRAAPTGALAKSAGRRPPQLASLRSDPIRGNIMNKIKPCRGACRHHLRPVSSLRAESDHDPHHEQSDHPPRPAARRAAPLQLRAPRRARRGQLRLAARQGLSQGRRQGRARLPQGRERLFRRGDEAPRGARRDAVPGDEGPHQGGRRLGPACATATISIGRRSSPARNIACGIASPSPAAPTSCCFDENAEAAGKDYFRLGAFAVSPDGKRLATLVDDDGSERFKLVVRDLATGKVVETVTEVGIGNPVWTSDSKGLVFTEVNDQWRSYRARYHVIGRPLGRDEDALRGEGRHRFLGRGRSRHRRQPDLHLERQQ